MTLEQWAALSEDESGELVAGFQEEEEVPDLGDLWSEIDRLEE
jgi:hypothetical protein